MLMDGWKIYNESRDKPVEQDMSYIHNVAILFTVVACSFT